MSEDSLDLSKLTPSQKSDLMENVKAQVAVSNFQNLLQTITDKCYSKCLHKPGTSLDSGETKCLGLCMDRYMDVQKLVGQVYSGYIQRQSGMR